MTKLKDIASYIRLKNAGPFWLTIDVFCDREADYQILKKSEKLEPEHLGKLFSVPEDSVKLFHLDLLKVIKISFPRPQVQGGLTETDMHAGQQYVRLLDLNIEEEN